MTESRTNRRPAVSGRSKSTWLSLLLLGLVLLAGWRLQAVSWQHDSASPLAIEDRREHRFRNLTYTQTQRLLDGLLRRAYAATTPKERALALARVAALQQERGLREAAEAAAREALQLSRSDPEVRALLSNPLRLEDIEPRRQEGGEGS